MSDVNQELIEAFIAVRDNPEKVILELEKWDTDEAGYYAVRAIESKDAFEKAARFLYLNANSFNGIYRVNKRGEYNVPYGHKNAKVDYKKLKEVSLPRSDGRGYRTEEPYGAQQPSLPKVQ